MKSLVSSTRAGERYGIHYEKKDNYRIPERIYVHNADQYIIIIDQLSASHYVLNTAHLI